MYMHWRVYRGVVLFSFRPNSLREIICDFSTHPAATEVLGISRFKFTTRNASPYGFQRQRTRKNLLNPIKPSPGNPKPLIYLSTALEYLVRVFLYVARITRALAVPTIIFIIIIVIITWHGVKKPSGFIRHSFLWC
jgi:hypothetical protein